MTFEYAERQRCIEIIYDEWTKADGVVKTEDVYERLRAEDIHPPPGAMDALLTSLEQQGLINTAKLLGREAIAQHGNMWITRVAERTPEELQQFAAILRGVVQGHTNIEDAQAAVQVEIPELAAFTRELVRTRNVQVRMAIINWTIIIIGWLLVAQNVHIYIENFAPDVDVTIEQDQPNP